jgi:Uma2 family endonuclease
MRAKARATIEDLYKVEGKAELVNGEIVEMPPAGDAPGYASGEIFATLRDSVRRTKQGRAYGDAVGFRLYGLTDEEIELIERPQYEQAFTHAQAQVVADEAITDDEEKIDKIAEGILPAARRFFERVEPTSVEELLDRELPNWRSLPPEAPTFLLTGDYNLRTPRITRISRRVSSRTQGLRKWL